MFGREPRVGSQQIQFKLARWRTVTGVNRGKTARFGRSWCSTSARIGAVPGGLTSGVFEMFFIFKTQRFSPSTVPTLPACMRSSSADGRVEKSCSVDAQAKLGTCGLLPALLVPGMRSLIASMFRWGRDAPSEAHETQDEPVRQRE